jgi:hypothetical protein
MNTQPPKDFAQRLVAAQHVDSTLRQQYEREVKTMLEKKLTLATKTLHWFVGLLSAAMAVSFAVVAIIGKVLPWEARLGFAVGTLFASAWTFLMIRTIRRGTINLRFDEEAQAGFSWGFVVILVTLFMLIGGRLPDKLTGISMVVNGLVFLIGAAVFLLSHVINESRMKLEERLLETQLKIAELAEELKKRP